MSKGWLRAGGGLFREGWEAATGKREKAHCGTSRCFLDLVPASAASEFSNPFASTQLCIQLLPEIGFDAIMRYSHTSTSPEAFTTTVIPGTELHIPP